MTETVSETFSWEVADVNDNGGATGRYERRFARSESAGLPRRPSRHRDREFSHHLDFPAWGGIIPYVGPAFGYSADGTGAWHWDLAHTVLALVPGAIGVIVGILILGETRASW